MSQSGQGNRPWSPGGQGAPPPAATAAPEWAAPVDQLGGSAFSTSQDYPAQSPPPQPGYPQQGYPQPGYPQQAQAPGYPVPSDQPQTYLPPPPPGYPQPGQGYLPPPPPPPGYVAQPAPGVFHRAPPPPGFQHLPPSPNAPRYYPPPQAQAKPGNGVALMLGGIGLAAVGIIITSVTYSSASSGRGGGTYFVAYGPIAVGVVWFFRGLARTLSGRP